MGLAIGGIAEATPLKRWGYAGALTTGQDTGAIPVSGLSTGDVLKITILFRWVANDASNNTFTVRVNDGAAKDFSISTESTGVNQVFHACFIIGNGYQIAAADWNHDAGAGRSLYSTTAITMASITSITVLNAAAGGTSVINGVEVAVLEHY